MTFDEGFLLVLSVRTMLNQFPQTFTFTFINDRYSGVYWFFYDGPFSCKFFEGMIFRDNIKLNWPIKVDVFVFVG